MKLKRNAGFSLVEILVVLVIMGLLISVVAPTVLNQADEARVQKAQADFKAIETALKIYRLDNYVYPTTEQGLEALVRREKVESVRPRAKEHAEERLLMTLALQRGMGPATAVPGRVSSDTGLWQPMPDHLHGEAQDPDHVAKQEAERQALRDDLSAGKLDQDIVEIELLDTSTPTLRVTAASTIPGQPSA